VKIVVIDPGHSGPFEPGACGPACTQEATITMKIGRMTAEELRAVGIKAILTRDGNINNDGLGWRADVANENNADAFVSIHCNAAENPEAEGVEVFTTPGQNDSDILADCIFEEIMQMMPDLTPRTDGSDGDPDKEANFTVISNTDCPSCLVETEFISNPDKEQILLNPGRQRLYAKAIAHGIGRFLSR